MSQEIVDTTAIITSSDEDKLETVSLQNSAQEEAMTFLRRRKKQLLAQRLMYFLFRQPYIYLSTLAVVSSVFYVDILAFALLVITWLVGLTLLYLKSKKLFEAQIKNQHLYPRFRRIQREGVVMMIPEDEIMGGDILYLYSGEKLKHSGILESQSSAVFLNLETAQVSTYNTKSVLPSGVFLIQGYAQIRIENTVRASREEEPYQQIPKLFHYSSCMGNLSKHLLLLAVVITAILTYIRGEEWGFILFFSALILLWIMPIGWHLLQINFWKQTIDEFTDNGIYLKRPLALPCLPDAKWMIINDVSGLETRDYQVRALIQAPAQSGVESDDALEWPLRIAAYCNWERLQSTAPLSSLERAVDFSIIAWARNRNAWRDQDWRVHPQNVFYADKDFGLATVIQHRTENFVAGIWRGLPEEILPRSSHVIALDGKITRFDTREFNPLIESLRDEGNKVLALACKALEYESFTPQILKSEDKLICVGLLVLYLKKNESFSESFEALQECRSHGIRPAVITSESINVIRHFLLPFSSNGRGLPKIMLPTQIKKRGLSFTHQLFDSADVIAEIPEADNKVFLQTMISKNPCSIILGASIGQHAKAKHVSINTRYASDDIREASDLITGSSLLPSVSRAVRISNSFMKLTFVLAQPFLSIGTAILTFWLSAHFTHARYGLGKEELVYLYTLILFPSMLLASDIKYSGKNLLNNYLTIMFPRIKIIQWASILQGICLGILTYAAFFNRYYSMSSGDLMNGNTGEDYPNAITIAFILLGFTIPLTLISWRALTRTLGLWQFFLILLVGFIVYLYPNIPCFNQWVELKSLNSLDRSFVLIFASVIVGIQLIFHFVISRIIRHN